MVRVELIAHTPEPERVVAAAARLCYSARGAQELFDRLSDAEVKTLITRLRSMGHTSPFEHAQFTFAIEGISRVTSHQLVRHRIASYSQKSQRYVSENNFDFVIPPAVADNPKAKELYLQAMKGLQVVYQELCAAVPKEDARYVLPNSVETKIVATFNARSLLNFFRLRCCQRAQWEIRELAQRMLELVKEVAPNLFAQAGPNCVVLGYCPEGEFSCGKYPKQPKE